MNILQFNVRLAEGGAAGVALDLHQRALQQGLASHFVYGYGKGGKESVSHQKLSAGHQTYAADDRDGEHCPVSSV
ncbi:putative glycosyltransferase [Escherichia coli]|uniref:Putative glycosyltransferase n=1 Tax=Escherichia coli TaxID=562 RepID=A0A377D7T0_ECOLX|nr:putative glycosyltransferase [Escherichia coli]